jgi:DNA damage-binding protein 1
VTGGGSDARPIPNRKGKGKARSNVEDGPWAVEIENEQESGEIDVKERWMNLAPLKDYCVVEEEGGGMVSV